VSLSFDTAQLLEKTHLKAFSNEDQVCRATPAALDNANPRDRPSQVRDVILPRRCNRCNCNLGKMWKITLIVQLEQHPLFRECTPIALTSGLVESFAGIQGMVQAPAADFDR
jgi:hypothetical protein